MDKHTKHLLFFYGALLLATVAAFCIMFVLPQITSGRSPPIAADYTNLNSAI